MAVLADEERRRIWAHIQRKWREWGLGTTAFTKDELRAAVNAADQWASDNAASYNAALPQPFRGTATASQKAVLLFSVIARRAGLRFLRTDEDG